MKGSVIRFRLESHTSNTSSWFARTQKTHKFLSRESVIAALLNTDWVIQKTDADYDPEFVYGDSGQFYATPAMPENISVRKQEVGSQIKDQEDYDKPQEHILAYGFRELIAPGSKFRALVWGDYPSFEEGNVTLIGKERAEVVIEEKIETEVKVQDYPDNPHQIELLKIPKEGKETTEKEIFLENGGQILRTDTETQRYDIVIGEGEKYLKISDWSIPAIKGVTLDEI